MTERATTGYIGAELRVHGRLTGSGDMDIEGRFEGEIHIGGRVTVGPEAVVAAPVRVESLDVDGVVRGDVAASAAVSVRAGGCIEGDVRAQRIAIDDGGILRGGVQMEFDLPKHLVSGEENRG